MDKKSIQQIKHHIEFLASDKLEGRRTGTAGEKLAYEYISKAFQKAGLAPKGENETYLQPFDVDDGKAVTSKSVLNINGKVLELNKEYFPFAFNKNGVYDMNETTGSPFFWDLKNLLEENKDNPHFSLQEQIISKAKQFASNKATALFVFNSSSINDELKFEAKSKADPTDIPVVYLLNEAKNNYINLKGNNTIHLCIDLEEKKRIGHNVIGYINNNASNTVIIGAHYDHLGYGEDHTSLFTGTSPEIHNGADDNASGTAALIELSKMILASPFKNNNYVFISFSGEELGLFGSKYFADHPTYNFSSSNYMINMDMVGRLNDSTHGLTIGGYGTSPTWGELIQQKDGYFSVKFDSSGSGPSDHTSFYRKDIPVLFFFTGLHSDYHKPSDDVEKINFNGELKVIQYIYELIGKVDGKGKLNFTKTKEFINTSKSNFKVTLGIMPDYTFSGTGVRADGISEGRPAQKAGLKAGDIIIQLGENNVSEMQSYMEALSKFKKGDKTTVKVKRGNEEKIMNIEF